jgi:hypothetical protein
VQIWNRLIDDPKLASRAADRFDVVLGIAQAFDAVKDWPDAQASYRVAMKIATYNYVEHPSDETWRDKAEATERASVVAGKAAETTPADTPH